MYHLRLAVGRNLSLFLQNKLNIVVSFFSIVVIMSFYFIFLRNFVLQMVAEHGVYEWDQQVFADRLMVAGLLIVVTTTACFGGIQIVIKDKEGVRWKEPVFDQADPMLIAAAYWIATAVISTGFTLFTFAAYEAYFSFRYGAVLSIVSAGKAVGLIVLSSTLNAGILLAASWFVPDTEEYATFFNLYGLLIGFLAPAYLPYFFYGGLVRKVLYYVPCTQFTSLMRSVCLREELSGLHNELTGRELAKLQQVFGISLEHRGSAVSTNSQLSLVILSMALVLVVVRILAGRNRLA